MIWMPALIKLFQGFQDFKLFIVRAIHPLNGLLLVRYIRKVCFDGMTYRTARVNEEAHLIFLINSQLGAKKIGQNLIFQACPIR
jgi:hypothetical protein